jgi:hypothetical protein
MENKTWKIVPKPRFLKILDGRLSFKVKTNADGTLERIKARLVIKGYKQQFGIDYNETFACLPI